MAEYQLSLTHVSEDTLNVTTTPQKLPLQRAMDGAGNYISESNGHPRYLNPTHAIIYVVGQPIRWRADGVAPSSAPGGGQVLLAGERMSWTDPMGNFKSLIRNAQFIRHETATANATLEISFFA